MTARASEVKPPDSSRRIPTDAPEVFITRALVAAGMPDAGARSVAELMTLADLRGQDGHGIFRLPQYVRRIRAGGINLRPKITVVSERPAAALVDGDNDMGHLVMRFAAGVAIKKAESAGIGWVGVRGSNHAGPAALSPASAATPRSWTAGPTASRPRAPCRGRSAGSQRTSV